MVMMMNLVGSTGCLDFTQFDCFQASSGCMASPDLSVSPPRLDLPADAQRDERDHGTPRDHTTLDLSHPNTMRSMLTRDAQMNPRDAAPARRDQGLDLDRADQRAATRDQSLEQSISDMTPTLRPIDMTSAMSADAMVYTALDQRLAVEEVTDRWRDGYCRYLSITNMSAETIEGWSVRVEIEGTLDHAWNAEYSGIQGSVTFSHLEWNRVVTPQMTREFGFCGSY